METIAARLSAYRDAGDSVRDHLLERRDAIVGADPHNAWISVIDTATLSGMIDWLEQQSPSLPLYGVPFAVKDNIDVAGLPTTAGCPAYCYWPDAHAAVVERLMRAGAIPLGKTNLDQFATGLVGSRSPNGACRNAFDRRRVSGGSSAGSAVAVALGQVAFALGTDTAGSGRVPAAFNNLMSLKPTRGRLSTRGVVPACRSLDCVNIFGLCGDDLRRVFEVVDGFDPLDPQSRPPQPPAPLGAAIPPGRFALGVPRDEDLEFFGDDQTATAFHRSIEALEALGGEVRRIDLTPFLEAARLLYEGPWVAERYSAIRGFIESQPDALLPVTRQIIGAGAEPLACDLFTAQHRLAELRRATESAWAGIDCLVTPTAGHLPTLEAVEADPVGVNSQLGYYTNFMNLLDLSAVAAPGGFTPDGLPFGLTLSAPAFMDRALIDLAERLQRHCQLPLGTGRQTAPAAEALDADHGEHRQAIAVCGAHMSGLPLNETLIERGGRHLQTTRTAALYRLYALPGGPPARPGLVRVDADGHAVEVEVWTLPRHRVGDFLDTIPAPLGLGRITLEDGREVTGFICEAWATASAEDISALGSWRRYLTRPA
ncbi:allophanate hydrolase [Spiribacter roseus]|uniref:Allophanate hydrolase n=1 Tax=Spiribacter roseus TaxID=1855875 RepID=A0ABV3RYZ4_9GAMM